MSAFVRNGLLLLFVATLRGQEPVTPAIEGAAQAERTETLVEIHFTDRSWFTDTVATAIVPLPETIEYPEDLPRGGGDISIVSMDVVPIPNSDGTNVVIRWIPEREGLLRFPSLEFVTETTLYRSPSREILVSTPLRTSEMELSISPSKQLVYAGEALRLDVRWNCGIPAKRVRAMRCNPPFFNSPAVEVVVPRSTAPEASQLGLPFGGRRVIAERHLDPDRDVLGEVTFPVFIRFSEPGTYPLPAVYLECAQLKEDGGAFAPYAAYFNNGLFEEVDHGAAYDRVFVESAPFSIEVLPLPEEGRHESFSGLFTPCSIEVSATPEESEVGQLVQIDIEVKADAPHGFLELPDLTKQRGLRSWFKIDRELGRAWHAEGTMFRTRTRPLTTSVEAFPALEIQLFDPGTGSYRTLFTNPIPLRVKPHQGRDYFDVKTLGTERTTLTDHPEGIWHNRKVTTMNSVLNALGNILADFFWLLLAAGPLLFFLLLPWVREARHRAIDSSYRERQKAYRAFRRLPEGAPEKWTAFKAYLATCLKIEPEAWTPGDARRELAARGVADEDLEVVVGSHEDLDAEAYSATKPPARLPRLNPVAQRIARILAHSAVILLACLGTDSAKASPDHWESATLLFAKAQTIEGTAQERAAGFAQAALKFEAAAESREHAGRAWYNAGNAWFRAGEVGRSIACYRQSKIFRPFDPLVQDNLAAARALTIDVVADQGSPRWLQWPTRWLRALLVPSAFLFWGLLLGFIRFRTSTWLSLSAISLAACLLLGGWTLRAHFNDESEGVVIAAEIYGRKGPSYRFQTTFNEPLHDGLEFVVVEKRDDWLLIELSDERRCWIPANQVRLLYHF